MRMMAAAVWSGGVSLLLAGCVTRGYEGELPPGQVAAQISFSTGSGLQLEATTVDGFGVGVISGNIEVAPGTRSLTTGYHGERWLCEGDRQPCRVVLFGGVCKATVDAANDGRYRARIEPTGDESARIVISDRATRATLSETPCQATRRSVRYRDASLLPID
jgi:hypothetical protein